MYTYIQAYRKKNVGNRAWSYGLICSIGKSEQPTQTVTRTEYFRFNIQDTIWSVFWPKASNQCMLNIYIFGECVRCAISVNQNYNFAVTCWDARPDFSDSKKKNMKWLTQSNDNNNEHWFVAKKLRTFLLNVSLILIHSNDRFASSNRSEHCEEKWNKVLIINI